MYPTVFAIALNHKSQTEHWHDTFLEAPYKALPKKAVWFIKPRNTYNTDGQITLDQGEQYFSGGTIAIVIGKTASRIKQRALSTVQLLRPSAVTSLAQLVRWPPMLMLIM